ncbi:flavin monoamine oxidase family protein [Rhabdaerophilum calidifontis]|uniref:flavin monoamine oxidase family protein n=1 Tax=Rhabdaerophilum calidifontis TaxID=2604328 RepID=UPI0012384B94|nr:FAD-dependent oxidoreductase [Rhabdaerophilum calidifontis]
MPSRRQVNAALLAAPFLCSRRARAAARAEVDVAIIGAGAAGLAAAHRAREKGLTARVIEARERVGGRIYTDASLGPAFDAGAFYIHFAERNPWREIALGLGAELVDDNTLWGSFNVFREGRPIPAEERSRRRGAFGRLSDAIDREPPGEDLSFAETARRHAPDLIEAAEAMTLLSLGENADRVSIRDYQALDSGDDLVLPGGYGTLLARYAAGLDIRLGTMVTGIDLSGAVARIESAGGVLTARAVIVTVPLGVLQAEAIRVTPRLPLALVAALDGLRMGALTKVALRVEGTRFGLSPWSQFFDQGRADDLVNFEFWPFDRDIVVAMFGGDFARALAAAGEAAAIEAIRARLVAILGAEAAGRITGGRLAGWSADPLARGAYSVALPGRMTARAALEAPVADLLWLAGEANAGAASMTAGGAALSAIRAVDGIAHRLAAAR